MSLPEMSASGAVLILTVAVIRALTLHKLPKRTFPVLWDVALVRLLVPYAVPSPVSVYSLMRRLAPVADKAPVLSPALPMENTSPVTDAFAPKPSVPAADPWVVVWLMGAVGLGIFFAAVYFKCRGEFRASLPVESDYAKRWLQAHRLCRPVTVRQSDRISAPLTYGVLCPVILMPKTTDWTDEETLGYVLEHEYVHIRRLDAVTKLALTCALCVHWFNPAVWLLYVLANRDMELSCDEAVIRGFGEGTKSAYAMALIRMEETRSGPSPLCNHFSKNAIEERIIAIMKIKRTSLAALLAAVCLVASVTAAFATSAEASGDTVQDDTAVMSYTDPVDGKTYYSRDGGRTWTPETGEELEAAWDGVEWWTEEEYAAWLEQEKLALRSIIGEKGWNPTDGWYTWTQELVDEAIARYEQTLRDIRAGQKISKLTADGDTVIQFGYAPTVEMTATDTTAFLGSVAVMDSAGEDAVVSGSGLALTPALLAEYEAHGLTYDGAKGAFYFNEKPVRYFFDGYTLENGVATIYDYVSKDGVVDVHTVRQATRNADGSTDPGGRLMGIEAYSQEEFDSRCIMTQTMTRETASTGFVGSTGGVTFEERFARYQDWGITYAEAPNVSGQENVYLNGQPVSRFSDVSPDGSVFSFTSANKGGIAVRTVYDSSGKLSGVEVVEE